jgi:hypothetical protein
LHKGFKQIKKTLKIGQLSETTAQLIKSTYPSGGGDEGQGEGHEVGEYAGQVYYIHGPLYKSEMRREGEGHEVG